MSLMTRGLFVAVLRVGLAVASPVFAQDAQISTDGKSAASTYSAHFDGKDYSLAVNAVFEKR